MALTKPRAYQIYDIDYKQATRVLATADITLSGGAPNQVDGVNLSLNDRVLVIGQDPASENGIYYVTTVGTGSNGTWARSIDTNTTGELLAGTIVMVTEGLVYADTQWKLVTDDPITIGVSELIFEQNSAFAFGNVYANGTAVLATSVGDVLTLTPGDNIAITGNNTSKTVTIGVTGISLNSISNGTSNVNVVSSGGNVTVGISGTSNVAVFSTTGANITGTLGVSGNITGGNLITSGNVSGNVVIGNSIQTNNFTVSDSLSIGNQIIYAQGSDGFSVNEDFNAGNATVTAYHYTSGAGRNAIVFDTAVTGQFTSGFGASGNAASNKFVFFAEFGNTFWEWRKSVGISAPNLNGGTLLANISADGNLWTAGTITGTGNITGGNLTTAGQVVATGNVGGNNVNATSGITAGTTISATANVAGGNLTTAGQVVAVGNITGGNILGNGAGLSGINAFSNVTVTGGNSAVADSIADTLTLTAGDGIAITIDSTTDTITIAASGGSEIFVDGADFGTVTEAVTISDDLGLVTEAVEAESDLGSIVTSGVFYPDLLVLADVTDFIIYGGNSGQYLGTAGNGILQWQTLDSAPLTGNMAGNINGNTYSIINLASLETNGTITGGNLTVGTGTITGGNIVNSNANGVGNIGSSTTYFNTAFVKATSAQYADLAEMYVADTEYTPGTVVVFGGDKEVTVSTSIGDHRVAGVISTNPSYIMNGGLDAEHVVAVALTGRVPTKVLGPINKGDLMISAPNGYAQACNQPSFGTVIGKSLENLTKHEGVIEIVVGVR